MRILLIEDEAAAARAVEMMLSAGGFNVDAATTGEEGCDLAQTYSYDAIVLDMNLGDMTGLEVLRTLRHARVATPVIVLSGAHEVGGKVGAFNAGADDYVVKPCHRDELGARLRAVIRRSAGVASSQIVVGDLCLNLDARMVQVNGQRIHLTGKEYQMLELLALRRGKPVCKDTFLTSLYGGMDEPGAKIIDVFICKLRQKLATVTGRQHIETVWGGGYVLRDPAEIAVKAAA